MSVGSVEKAETSAVKLLDVEAVADLLQCSTRTVYRLADGGKMPSPMKLGALVRWSKASIESWIAGGCKPIRSGGRGARP